MIYGLITVIILILTFCFWFLISFRKNTLTLFFMIPIILGSVVLGHLTYQQILGYPTEIRPVGKYRLVSFYVVPKTDIYLWILKPEEIIPRAYRIDYSKSNRKKLHGSYKHTTFYAACVAKAFEHLHERRIIYRDLKPENMLYKNNETNCIKMTSKHSAG